MLPRLASIIAIATLLTGCWLSSAPLMPASAWDKVPISGEYVLSSNADPHRNSLLVPPPSALRATLQGSQLQIVSHTDDQIRMVSFDQLQPNFYLAQSSFVTPHSRIDFYIVAIEDAGASIRVMVPPCGEPQRKLGGSPSEDDANYCRWTNYAGMRQAALQMIRSEPATAGVRQIMIYKRK